MCGAGHLYAGRLVTGIIKIIMIVGFCVLYGVLKANLNTENEVLVSFIRHEEAEDKGDHADLSKYLGLFFCFLCCILLVWQVIDLFMFGLNKYHDGNGATLYSW
jgi:hypothetical protein